MPQPSISSMEGSYADPFSECGMSFSPVDQTLHPELYASSPPCAMYDTDDQPCWEMSLKDKLDYSNGTNWGCDDLTSTTSALDSDLLSSFKCEKSDGLWGSHESDFFGIDDTSSPYQDKIDISHTPTLAELNSEDSQSIFESLIHPDLQDFLGQTSVKREKKPATSLPTGPSRPSPLQTTPAAKQSTARVANNTDQDFAGTFQVQFHASAPGAPPTPTTHTISRPQTLPSDADMQPCMPDQTNCSQLQQLLIKPSLTCVAPRIQAVVDPNKVMPAVAVATTSSNVEVERKWEEVKNFLEGPDATPQGKPELQSVKTEEHNYSMFAGESGTAGDVYEPKEEDMDSDHDEGFDSDQGSEDDDDDNSGDSMSEPGTPTLDGCSPSGSGRKRQRFFWEYGEHHQPVPRTIKEKIKDESKVIDPDTPANLHLQEKSEVFNPALSKGAAKKIRRGDTEDLTPNPRKLILIGEELRKLNKTINELTPVSELPLSVRPKSRKEKNKLASRACRLKKKAQHEANKIKLQGLESEHGKLCAALKAIKREMAQTVGSKERQDGELGYRVDKILKTVMGKNPMVAGHTGDFVNRVLDSAQVGNRRSVLINLDDSCL
ncbi:CREB3 regulatory factor-like isoform X1 [Branchiostoma lanceolatum]|uniref:CREB3 regulatory factor-like isoform X1 n=2 Tax=Branchiostoma lanceolatum TaxID=7740 RepID=UPI003453E8CC